MSYNILYTADLHGNKEFYKKLIEKAKENIIRAVVIGGDLCPKRTGTLKQSINYQKEFLKTFFIPQLSILKKDIFFIMGNDDFRINETILKNTKKSVKQISGELGNRRFPVSRKSKRFSRMPEIQGISEHNNNLNYINKNRCKLFNKNIVGYSFVNPTPFRLKDWEKFEDEKQEKSNQFFDYEIRTVKKEEGTIKEDLSNLIKLSNPKKTIYVFHTPPFNTKLDIITDGTHVGSKALREFIEKQQPYLTLHGHIHESPKMSGSFIDKIDKTICINVGSSYPKMKLNCVVIDIKNLDVKYLEL